MSGRGPSGPHSRDNSGGGKPGSNRGHEESEGVGLGHAQGSPPRAPDRPAHRNLPKTLAAADGPSTCHPTGREADGAA